MDILNLFLLIIGTIFTVLETTKPNLNRILKLLGAIALISSIILTFHLQKEKDISITGLENEKTIRDSTIIQLQKDLGVEIKKNVQFDSINYILDSVNNELTVEILQLSKSILGLNNRVFSLNKKEFEYQRRPYVNLLDYTYDESLDLLNIQLKNVGKESMYNILYSCKVFYENGQTSLAENNRLQRLIPNIPFNARMRLTFRNILSQLPIVNGVSREQMAVVLSQSTWKKEKVIFEISYEWEGKNFTNEKYVFHFNEGKPRLMNIKVE